MLSPLLTRVALYERDTSKAASFYEEPFGFSAAGCSP